MALSNLDQIAEVSTRDGTVTGYFSTTPSAQEFPGAYPTALAQSSDGKYLFVANSSLDAVAVFDTSTASPVSNSQDPQAGMGFIPTDWYPSALAVQGSDLLIATAKGEGAGPNKQMGKTAEEIKHHQHAYIATLIRGSVARLNIASTLKQLPQLTQTVERDNLFHSDPGTIAFAAGQNPIKHVIYVLKENRTYDQVLGDLKVGNGDSSLTMYGEDSHAQ